MTRNNYKDIQNSKITNFLSYHSTESRHSYTPLMYPSHKGDMTAIDHNAFKTSQKILSEKLLKSEPFFSFGMTYMESNVNSLRW